MASILPPPPSPSWQLLAIVSVALSALLLTAAAAWIVRQRWSLALSPADDSPPLFPTPAAVARLAAAAPSAPVPTDDRRGGGADRRKDIDDRDALRLSRDVLRHLPSGIVYFDRAGLVQEANPAARAALGFASPYGLRIVELFRDAELNEPDGTLLGRAADLIADTYRSMRILQRKTLNYSTPGGERRRLGITLCPLQNRNDTSGIICLLTDLTAIHALEEEVQRRRNLSALGEMAAGIAHEFKNSLATISGYAQMLESGLTEAEPRDHVHRILEEVTTLSNVATEFLTFARPLEVQPEAVSLRTLLADCLVALRVQDFPQVRLSVEDDLPEVAGDPVWLTYAFMNLLRNSCEAIAQSGQGSQVMVRRRDAPPGEARIQFVDDGPGVDPAVAEKIFIPFFTTKRSGSGLGLSMVHKIVTAHRGSVLLADASAGNTVFEVRLPTSAAE